MIDRVIDRFRGTDDLDRLSRILEQGSPSERYQHAMEYLVDCRGQEALNQLVRDAVLEARSRKFPSGDISPDPSVDPEGWWLPPAVEALGRLIVTHPNSFQAPVLTSNFDPLLEVAIWRARGRANAIFVPGDGTFRNVLSPGSTNIVHFHGFWTGSDTLHTPTQLTRPRPKLKGDLRELLRNTTLVVMGYGGWSDVFTRTLVEVISEQSERLDVLWTFYSDDESDLEEKNGGLLRAFDELAGQRVLFYKGIDCHLFLPLILDQPATVSSSPPVRPSAPKPPEAPTDLECDSPPSATVWVGRSDELRSLLDPALRVVAITGIGGQGKSCLAAKLVDVLQTSDQIEFWDWRDCKEQANTLHTQLVSIVERLTGGRITGADLASYDTNAIVNVMFRNLNGRRAVFVFDNIDQYVDVARNAAIRGLHTIITTALQQGHDCRFIVTCRPRLSYPEPSFFELVLDGFTTEETRELFDRRNVVISPADVRHKIDAVHALTNGHPLWLNLIATQVARNKADLDRLVESIGHGSEADLPDRMLREIWKTVNPKQQYVLRTLAEAVRPEPEQRLAQYVSDELNFNQFSKALRVLKSLDLVVVKSSITEVETIELHPVVKEWIRRRFAKAERKRFIDPIRTFLSNLVASLRHALHGHFTFSVLDNWLYQAEVSINAEAYSDAFETLSEVSTPLLRLGHSGALIRLALQLFGSLEWTPNVAGTYPHYDNVFSSMIHALVALGRTTTVDELLEKFEQTVVSKGSRYVLFCDLKCYSLWYRGKFEDAKVWGIEGVRIKTESHVDTEHDCGTHLALARRDSGEIDAALTWFLQGSSLDDLTKDDTIDDARPGEYYGNIARCLYLKGDASGALRALRKSARLLRDSQGAETLLNQGYAAFWIGEACEKLGRLEDAYVAYRRAADVWRVIAPPKWQLVVDALARIGKQRNGPDYEDAKIVRLYSELIP